MKSDLTSLCLTFVLGVLAVTGVFVVLRTVIQMHELQKVTFQATSESRYLNQTQVLLNEVEAYNKKNPGPELTRLLQNIQAKAASAK